MHPNWSSSPAKNISFLIVPNGVQKKVFTKLVFLRQVLAACFEVFGAWDDEYEKLQGLLRDMFKKKREDHLKMVWRVNPAHKRLQMRLDQMRKYVR